MNYENLMKYLLQYNSDEWIHCGQNNHHCACKWRSCWGCLHHWNCALLDTQQKEERWEFLTSFICFSLQTHWSNRMQPDHTEKPVYFWDKSFSLVNFFSAFGVLINMWLRLQLLQHGVIHQLLITLKRSARLPAHRSQNIQLDFKPPEEEERSTTSSPKQYGSVLVD